MEFGINKIINTHVPDSCELNFTDFCEKLMNNIKELKFNSVKNQILRCISERIVQMNGVIAPDWGHIVVIFHLINLYENLFDLKTSNFEDHEFKISILSKIESNHSIHYGNIENETSPPPFCQKWSLVANFQKINMGFYLHNNDTYNKECFYFNNNLRDNVWKLKSNIYNNNIENFLRQCADKINEHITNKTLLKPGELLTYCDNILKQREYPFTGREHGPNNVDRKTINVLEYYSKPYDYNLIRRTPDMIFYYVLKNKLIQNYVGNSDAFFELKNKENEWYNNYINEEKNKKIISDEKKSYAKLSENIKKNDDGFRIVEKKKKKKKHQKERTVKEKYLKYKLKYLKLKELLNLQNDQ